MAAVQSNEVYPTPAVSARLASSGAASDKRLPLGNRTDIAKLYISEFNGGMHRIYESFCCGKTALEVPIRRLDSIFKPGQISVIKIDVEGFEPFVLEGAKSLIEGQQLTIISEYCPPAMLEAGVLIVQYLDNLRKWGLKVFGPSGYLLDWDFLIEDAINWDNFGRQRLLDACDGKSIPDISAIVEQQAKNLGCLRPYIENLVFRS